MINEVLELQEGKVAHKGGDLASAVSHYEKILAANPRNADALHLMGLIYKSRGDSKKAIDYIQQAIAISKTPLFYDNLGVVYYDLEMYPEAIEIYEKVTNEINPKNVDGYVRLAALRNKQKRADLAINVLKKGLANIPKNMRLYSDLIKNFREEKMYLSAYHCMHEILDFSPKNADIVLEIGTLYFDLNDEEQALKYIERALSINPNLARAYYYLGMILKNQRKLQEAEGAFRKALEFSSNAFIYNQLSFVLRDLGRIDEGMECMKKAREIDPNNEGYEFNVANYLFLQRQYQQAEEGILALLKKNPNHANAYNLLSMVHIMKSKPQEALRLLEKAIEFSPDDETLNTNYGIMQLSFGNFKEGWRYYENRYSYNEKFKKNPALKMRNWIGQDMTNKTLYIITEQGAGDYLHFLRYIPLIKERFHPKKIYLQTLKSMVELVKNNFSNDVEIIASQDQVPAYDFHCAITSLGFIFDTTLETIPHNIPYIHSGKEDVKVWSERIPKHKELNVGLAWAGNAVHKNNVYRSINLADLEPLLNVPNCKFYSLQVGDRTDQVKQYVRQVTDLSKYLTDYAQTAAAIERLDFVISVDTSIVHLAGAMGKPAWVLIPFNPDWRWMFDRVDTPWYPALKLFRQKEPLLWAPVVDAVRKELMERVQLQKTPTKVTKVKKAVTSVKHAAPKKAVTKTEVKTRATKTKVKKKTSK